MSEMVERVARASFAEFCKRNELSFKFEDMNDEELEFAMLHAKACIDAMREPTGNMLFVAGSSALGFSDQDVRAGWQLMIDEALK